ncbi:GPW/gp25 family protein [Geobacter sp.]|uniref:GPW/gp25 family protein n=1 Tax=Geobacter sp. TaxID=46610 RepID=UPI0026290D9D|nr:GPW/gp25 family protein [Geobacter sp.]
MNGESDIGKEFLGAGVGFPLAVDGEGRLVMTRLEEHVRQSILLILRTMKGERVMRPDFGSGLDSLVFSPVGAATAALAEHEVKEALIRFEPRIEVLSVRAATDPQQQELLLITLEYRVRRTDTLFNLVYPFYLEKGAP